MFKTVKQHCAKAGICAALIAVSVSTVFAAPVDTYGTLSVSGSVIKGSKNGAAARLRGMSLYWSHGNAGRDFYNSSVVNWLAEDWHANIVRAAMAIEPEWSPTELPYLKDANGNKQRVTAVVDACIAKGIYAIIDWHDHNAPTHQSQAISFFTEMAQKYKGKPNVIYEIFNEPDQESWDVIKNYAKPVIEAIRKVDSTNLIIVGTPKWSSDVETAASSPLTGYKNIAYAFHMYASEDWHFTSYMKAADNAISKGLPLFVTEWGLTLASGDGAINTSRVDAFMSWMETKQLSSCAWSICDLTETSAALKAGSKDGSNWKHNVSTTGNWGASDLAQTGTYMRNKLRTLNPEWSPAVSVHKSTRSTSNTGLQFHSVNNAISVNLGPAPWNTVQVFSLSGRLLNTFVNATGMITLPKQIGASFLKVSRNGIESVVEIPSM